jgi:hypothetical protein
LVRKESIGFVFNRVWRAIKKECLHLVAGDVAWQATIDFRGPLTRVLAAWRRAMTGRIVRLKLEDFA